METMVICAKWANLSTPFRKHLYFLPQMAVKVAGNDTVISSIKISRKVKIIQAFEASDTTDSDLGGSGCGISVVLGVWQVGIGHLWLDNRLHRVALHVVHR